MKKAAALFMIIRPVNFVITFIVIAAGYIISAAKPSLFILIAAALSGSLTAGCGNIVNDIFDIESDKINHPSRPLPSETIKYHSAKILWFILAFASFVISSFISNYAFLIVLGCHILLIIYSFKLKSLPLTGNFVIATLTGMAFLYGGYAAGDLSQVILPALFAFFINYIREMVKDIQDLKGDLAVGVISFPVKFGIKNAKKLILVFIAMLMILTLYPFLFHYYKIEYFLVIMVIVNPLLVYCARILLKAENADNYVVVSSVLKLNMAAGLLAIFLGK